MKVYDLALPKYITISLSIVKLLENIIYYY